MAIDKIIIKGARAHNLKNIDIEIPRDKLVIITGLSGSGKSSLAFDTIYAEGQRRYVESLSAYARQFLGQMDKPDVDYIEGLSPSISIDQKTTSRNPRSTVGTVTEIHDYLRLLFARIGQPHCPKCGKPISRQSIDQITDTVLKWPEGTKIQILAPLIRARKGEYTKLFSQARTEGYVRVRIDGAVRDLSEEIVLDKKIKHTIELVIDRLVVRPGCEKRLADSLELALGMAKGLVLVVKMAEEAQQEEEHLFSQNFACPDCGINMEEITPRLFSFNNPYGACPVCSGLGFRQLLDPDLIIPNKELTLRNGGLSRWNGSTQGWYFRYVEALADALHFSMDVPIQNLPKEALQAILYGYDKPLRVVYDTVAGEQVWTQKWEGIIPNFERRYLETKSDYIRNDIEKYMRMQPCEACHGARLKPEALAVTIGGKNIHELSEMSIVKLQEFFQQLQLTEREVLIAKQVLKEIRERLDFLVNVGLDYLTLSRAAGSLSGGEAQRIRLATQIGSHLMGVLYILDEPSIGLHQKDNVQLIHTLKKLRDLGNTVLVVEHDEETMEAADYIIDIGPGAGAKGGHIVAVGTPEEVMANENSITGQYLSGKKMIMVPEKRRKPGDKWITIEGAAENNLQNLKVSFPLGIFTCVTGVSGSGKSSLVNEILFKAASSQLNRSQLVPGKYKTISGLEQLEKVIDIDQSPIGRTPRSNPATYTGLFDLIRELYAQVPEAKMRGYKAGRFSFNVKGGRCESCQGDGIIKIEMHFLPDVYVPCEVCKGKRYNRETLDICYKGKNIADILDMTVDEASDFFVNHEKIHRKLQTLQDVGLGYVKLGQPATTLSGGEAQRIKLATELSRRSNGRTLYILDEPTTGLHAADIQKLLQVLNRLVLAGDTVIVIEHNLDVIKTADYIIDLGPDGGARGGQIIAVGTPEEVAQVKNSYTGQFIAKTLARDIPRQKKLQEELGIADTGK